LLYLLLFVYAEEAGAVMGLARSAQPCVFISASGVYCRYFTGKTGSLPGKETTYEFCKEDMFTC